MIINEINIDGKNILDKPLDLTGVMKSVSRAMDEDINREMKAKGIEVVVERNKTSVHKEPLVADKVSPSFQCVGRCDSCIYRNVHMKRAR